ncbi:cyclin-dependent kinase inhibitor 2c [Anaeramoeba flamelloides]|uniref:Cyclin-dependent kinase inhibitor 2c n=1 Tax=Anaeramoeba flamelloides TaxID=1746091 RepID=A0ABQ8Z042_9EUKA|nr:cyclin-dependent kinase inhibitor 2c [Anaeramoeba flamelloides]
MQDFCKAVKREDLEFIDKFSSNTKNLRSKMRNFDSPLHYALKNTSSFEIIKLMVQRGFNVNAVNSYKNTVLHLALQYHPTWEIISFLVEAGARVQMVNKYLDTPLHFACRYGASSRIITLLLKHGSLVNKKNSNKYTPLHYIVMSKNQKEKMYQLVETLLKNGANINSLNKGDTPLHQALKNSVKIEVIKLLVEKNSNLKIKNSWGDTPLSHAITTDMKTKIIKCLIEKTPNLNLRDKDGFTPIFHACTKPSRKKVLRLLLENKAKLNLVDKKGLSPLLHACLSKLPINEIELLLEYGALIKVGKKKAWEMTDDPETKKILLTHKSLQDDFRRILDKKIGCDIILNEKISFHKSMFEVRTGKKMDENTLQLLKKHPNNIIKRFLNWVYSGLISPKDSKVLQLAKSLNVENILLRRSKNSLVKDLQKLYALEETKDFSIIVEEKEIKIHKFVLMARSGLFRQMFNLVKDDNSINVKDFSSKSKKTLDLLIKFYYIDNIEDINNSINETVLEELEDADDYYRLSKYSRLPYILEKEWLKLIEN